MRFAKYSTAARCSTASWRMPPTLGRISPMARGKTTNGARQDDEELLTEQILVEILERVLGFPPDAYSHSSARAASSPTLRRWI